MRCDGWRDSVRGNSRDAMKTFCLIVVQSYSKCTPLMSWAENASVQEYAVLNQLITSSAAICASFHAVQSRIFRLVILSQRRGIDCMPSILLAKRILAF